MVEDYRRGLDEGKSQTKNVLGLIGNKHTVDWSKFHDVDWYEDVRTGVKLPVLNELAARVTTFPEGFTLHRQVQRIVDDRRKMAAGQQMLDWGFAETLAYASAARRRLRDSPDRARTAAAARSSIGTRSVTTRRPARPYIPLKHLKPGQPRFRVTDSLLSEEAVLGFEYGYSITDPELPRDLGRPVRRLRERRAGRHRPVHHLGRGEVGPHLRAHAVPAARLRRARARSIRPHASSASCSSCAENNMQVCVPSTPAQMFHMLRRQMMRSFRKPLIVMTPKSLLRHKLSVSSLEELAHGGFQLRHRRDRRSRSGGRRRASCSARARCISTCSRRVVPSEVRNVAIVRIEQLYPFPAEDYAARHRALPERARNRLVPGRAAEPGRVVPDPPSPAGAAGDNQELLYSGRAPAAAPATGIPQMHPTEQHGLVSRCAHGQTQGGLALATTRLRATGSSRKKS